LTNASEAATTAGMAKTILVVDDDPHIRQLLVFALQHAGFETIEAADGEAALAAVGRASPDLVILDINMPRLDGLEVCRRLRATSDLPILFLSSRDDEIDRVVGIELGGDDYVAKPFSPREVVARIGAILRRSNGRATPEAPPAVLARGALHLDTSAWTARFGDRTVALTATEFAILRALAAAPARVFSRAAIIDHVRGPDFALTDRTIDSHVRNLRAKFAAAGCRDLIITRPGIGYSLGACEAGNGA
jgi:two-component system OmpR family response regulator